MIVIVCNNIECGFRRKSLSNFPHVFWMNGKLFHEDLFLLICPGTFSHFAFLLDSEAVLDKPVPRNESVGLMVIFTDAHVSANGQCLEIALLVFLFLKLRHDAFKLLLAVDTIRSNAASNTQCGASSRRHGGSIGSCSYVFETFMNELLLFPGNMQPAILFSKVQFFLFRAENSFLDDPKHFRILLFVNLIVLVPTFEVLWLSIERFQCQFRVEQSWWQDRFEFTNCHPRLHAILQQNLLNPTNIGRGLWLDSVLLCGRFCRRKC